MITFHSGYRRRERGFRIFFQIRENGSNAKTIGIAIFDRHDHIRLLLKQYLNYASRESESRLVSGELQLFGEGKLRTDFCSGREQKLTRLQRR